MKPFRHAIRPSALKFSFSRQSGDWLAFVDRWHSTYPDYELDFVDKDPANDSIITVWLIPMQQPVS